MKKIGLIILLGLFIGISTSFVTKKYSKKSVPSPTSIPKKNVKGIASTPIATPSPTIINLRKTEYTIAIYGDSLIDTMGEGLDYLQSNLKQKYPKTTFHLYNYGIGSQNIETGIGRFNSEFHYQNRNYPPISQIQADIIIIGSFAYNPFTPHDRNKHYLLLKELIQQSKATGAKVYQLIEQAPLRESFGKGTNGVNWETNTAYEHSGHIIEQLEDAVNAAQDTGVPTINAFYPSRVGNGGNPAYVDGNDGIHPSVGGHRFMANLIVETIRLD